MSVRLFKSLLYKASQIQQKIEQENQRPWPDHFRLIKLKKIRLSIKERLQHLIERHQVSLNNKSIQLRPVPVKKQDRFYRDGKRFV